MRYIVECIVEHNQLLDMKAKKQSYFLTQYMHLKKEKEANRNCDY